jgi:hypothetical protein
VSRRRKSAPDLRSGAEPKDAALAQRTPQPQIHRKRRTRSAARSRLSPPRPRNRWRRTPRRHRVRPPRPAQVRDFHPRRDRGDGRHADASARRVDARDRGENAGARRARAIRSDSCRRASAAVPPLGTATRRSAPMPRFCGSCAQYRSGPTTEKAPAAGRARVSRACLKSCDSPRGGVAFARRTKPAFGRRIPCPARRIE